MNLDVVGEFTQASHPTILSHWPPNRPQINADFVTLMFSDYWSKSALICVEIRVSKGSAGYK